MSAMKRVLENNIAEVSANTGIDETVLYRAYNDMCEDGIFTDSYCAAEWQKCLTGYIFGGWIEATEKRHAQTV